MAFAWSADQYSLFERQRNRPIHDLLTALPAPPAMGHAIDLGCGPGNSTEILARTYPRLQIAGFDLSDDMVQAARARLPRIAFAVDAIESWCARADGPSYAVMLTNAVLQWLPDHDRLLPALIAHLAPGGSLAVQMPDNLDEAAHVAMRAVAHEMGTAPAEARGHIARADHYYTILRPVCTAVEIWRTVYYHVLPTGLDGIVDWFKGSGLRPFLASLPPAGQAEFLTRYRQKLADSYPILPDGAVMLPFPRLFIVATR